MSKRILVAVDGSEEAAEALRFAADEWPDADLTALHVINPADSATGADGGFPGASDQWYESAKQRGERVLAEVSEIVDRDVETRLEVGRPTKTILGVAGGEKPVGEDGEDGEPFDHLVLASRGRTGLSRVLLGSVAEGVVRRAEVPVTVVR
ncbi:universal stress protein [Halorubrum ezzemoulense]|jgi:nucleotide-binding universal stress UspA family protein|uniref:Universal stress protein n=2 Tax=Halorubrum ezzemoulense TaxID=337243 RepID=A0A256JAD6_HALEZ|nr:MULTISPECIES: universal stress protein [Halorubrum]MDB2224125.1 universal stress protein [Halorubrum ezzemoulense]MDB2238055.1 universal stress protein [Halorubrum ezzemoulense]MDB2240351.1 universal stress protein [Halorubrum ezzemoulense]MDB2243775.1 universal stress protein [Halorubrum ezzemoulense]MDB2247524.1 universal stress protein [Halorubrum ezzemoulense]